MEFHSRLQGHGVGLPGLLVVGSPGSLAHPTHPVKELLAAKADVNKPTKNGSTPLMRISRNNRVEIVKLLLAVGANKGAMSTSGETALTLATEKGRHEIVQQLQQAA